LHYRAQRLSELLEAKLSLATPSFVLAARRRRSAAQQAGLRYERAVHAEFAGRYPDSWLPSPWFAYRTAATPSVVNYAQTDALHINPLAGVITIIEVKKKHCAESYFQLHDKYLPLVSKCFGSLWEYRLVELCEWYDPHVAYPTKPKLVQNLAQADPRSVCVHIWKPEKRWERLVNECRS
jgi:hypothetical protein